MKFLRAEEGDETTPESIRPVMQIVPPPKRATNGHKRSPAHAAWTHAARNEAAPAIALPTPPAPTTDPAPAPAAPEDDVPAQPTQARAPAHAAPTHATPAHAVPALATPTMPAPVRVPAHAAPAETRALPPGTPPAPAPARPASVKKAPADRPLREVTNLRPAPHRVRPEMLDACVVALRRMGGPELQSVGVTSSVRGEGRSTVAAAMAVINAAEYRHTTILVELDGHKPSAAREFGLAEGPGVAEFMRDNLDIDECIQWVNDDLGVVVAGTDPSMAKLLSGSTAEDLVTALSEHADTLVLDLPPLDKGAGGVQLVDLCEAVALVVRAGVSTHRIEEAAALLTTPPFVILNGVKSAAPRWVRKLLGMR